MDKFISLILASDGEMDYLIKPTKLLLEGGNILANDSFILAGKDLLAQNILQALGKDGRPESSRELLEQMDTQFRTEFSVDHVIWVGTDRAREDWSRPGHLTYQPAFHLDLFITLGGKTEDGRQIVFVGDPKLTQKVLKAELKDKAPTFPVQIIQHFEVLDEFWLRHEMERGLGMPSFKVVPVPLFIHSRVIYSYNNCLVESYDGETVAYLPEYRVSEREDKYERLNPYFKVMASMVEEALLGNGFTKVNWLGPGKFFRKLSLMRGSLHCITKVLKRYPIAPLS